MRFLKENDDVKLIELVRDHPMLWDSKVPEYRNSGLTAECWVRIATLMRMDLATVKFRWRRLRDQFVRGKRVFSDQSRYHQDLLFLDTVVTHRKDWSQFSRTTSPPVNADVNAVDNIMASGCSTGAHSVSSIITTSTLANTRRKRSYRMSTRNSDDYLEPIQQLPSLSESASNYASMDAMYDSYEQLRDNNRSGTGLPDDDCDADNHAEECKNFREKDREEEQNRNDDYDGTMIEETKSENFEQPKNDQNDRASGCNSSCVNSFELLGQTRNTSQSDAESLKLNSVANSCSITSTAANTSSMTSISDTTSPIKPEESYVFSSLHHMLQQSQSLLSNIAPIVMNNANSNSNSFSLNTLLHTAQLALLNARYSQPALQPPPAQHSPQIPSSYSTPPKTISMTKSVFQDDNASSNSGRIKISEATNSKTELNNNNIFMSDDISSELPVVCSDNQLSDSTSAAVKLNNSRKIVDQEMSTRTTSDQEDIFGQYIAASLKKMPCYLRALTKLNIQKVIFEAELALHSKDVGKSDFISEVGAIMNLSSKLLSEANNYVVQTSR